ncbi:tripartite tricarboxylate transporter substrate binding protein [Bordetella sp. 15P40C-2]|uniref:Bug family tripartite tricarboxylate transporter substrate binding protein n=1 Tax=Bordetella sp. 15P40C-2 TaxID=2572246 RepID=UPI001326C568|nr:tripartite tricarboxylate transporter substrate binding protein [Bordetella sp. 15P40C-2]MVW70053.1 tripartite tricarboxylate transporter substrate binding protein [Bordetella sp. 15P40C-2]
MLFKSMSLIMKRKLGWIAAGAVMAMSIVPTGAVHAAQFPEKPVRIVVPFTAGGFTDILARRLAEQMSGTLGQPVIVENKAGASGIIGGNYVAKSPADGYTILLETPDTVVTGPMLMEGVQYKPSDLRQLSLLVQQPLVLVVSGKSQYKSLDDVMKAAKANPGALTYASWGNGSSAQIASSILTKSAGVNMTHVPYKGVANALTDLLGERVDMLYVGMLSTVDYLNDGRLRPIAINRSERAPMLPQVPTLAEAGFAIYPIGLWYAMGVPADTPTEVVNKLSEAARKAVEAPEVKKWLTDMGMDVPALDPAATEAFMKSEIENWGPAIRSSGASGN